MMNKDFDVALREMEILTMQARAGRIDVERWRDCVAFLRRIDCPSLAKSMEKSLAEFQKINSKLLQSGKDAK